MNSSNSHRGFTPILHRQNNTPFTWKDFGQRFSSYFINISEEEILIVDGDGHCITEPSPRYYNFGGDIDWKFVDNGKTCKSCHNCSQHPNIIAEILIGSAEKIEGVDEPPPRIALLSIGAATKQIRGQTAGKYRYRKDSVLLSIIYLFRWVENSIVVHRRIVVNGVDQDYDSLLLSSQYVGEVICGYAAGFVRQVLDPLTATNGG